MAAIAVTDGTARSAQLDTANVRVSDVEFGPARRLSWHAHPHGCIAVVVKGSVRKSFPRRSLDAGHGDLVTMPRGERHEDLFGCDGARIVVVHTDDVSGISCFRDWQAALLALRIGRELSDPDRYTPLAVEGLALELQAVAHRGPVPAAPARWLEDARELLHARLHDPPALAEVADAVAVHPGHLARAFRAQFGESLGSYARRLRLEWAADRLVRTDVRLACLAFEAGFVDQSHFTRAFKRQFGLTPARYRHAHG